MTRHHSKPYPSLPLQLWPHGPCPLPPPFPIMPRWEQVNGSEPIAASSVFLREQCTAATRLSGSSNMAPDPAPHGLAGQSRSVRGSVCIWVCVVNASPNAKCSPFKKWNALSSSVSPLWKGLFLPSGAGSYIFSSPEGLTARKMHLSSILEFNIY